MLFMGIDVSKAKLDCSLLLDVASGKRRAKTVANSKAGVSELLAWCEKHHVELHELHAILEGTGVYHEQAALALADAGVHRVHCQSGAGQRFWPQSGHPY